MSDFCVPNNELRILHTWMQNWCFALLPLQISICITIHSQQQRLCNFSSKLCISCTPIYSLFLLHYSVKRIFSFPLQFLHQPTKCLEGFLFNFRYLGDFQLLFISSLLWLESIVWTASCFECAGVLRLSICSILANVPSASGFHYLQLLQSTDLSLENPEGSFWHVCEILSTK